MLKVTIVNIDGSFHAIYDHDDKQKAVEALLATLVADHGFFPENEIRTDFPEFCKPDENQYGILAMPGEADNPHKFLYMTQGENTFEVYVEDYKPGSIITDR